METKRYRVFRRTAKNWEQFARARKTTQRRGLTYADALAMCKNFNDNRNAAQRRNGTKFEFEQE